MYISLIGIGNHPIRDGCWPGLALMRRAPGYMFSNCKRTFQDTIRSKGFTITPTRQTGMEKIFPFTGLLKHY